MSPRHDEIRGRLLPSARLDAVTIARIRLTIMVFRLNAGHRCRGRLRVVHEVSEAWKNRREDTLQERANKGPYRFVARRTIAGLEWKEAATAESINR